VEHRTFSGSHALQRGQTVLYVTERCVFQLTPDGMELIEVAPGIDIDRDILPAMDFPPLVKDPKVMDARIFADGPMGLRDDLLSIPIDHRFIYNAQQNLMFINFEGLQISRLAEIDQIHDIVAGILAGLGKRAFCIVNYDNFSVLPDLLNDYASMVKSLTDKYYSGVTRYTTSLFLRLKLGGALSERGVAPHIYESGEEARLHLWHLGEQGHE
jgi:propionate CoA-transferase